jgi:hypothetical protein
MRSNDLRSWMPLSSRSCSDRSGESSPRYACFCRGEITPAATEKFERRLERIFREMARRVVQWTFGRVESRDPAAVASSFEFDGQRYRRNRRTKKRIDTRFGVVTIKRWFYQNGEAKAPGLAPLDVRLGLFGNRMTPALAEVTGRLAADMPQSAARAMLRERFGATPGVAAYRRIVADLASQVRTQHDDAAIEQLAEWIDQARKSVGKHEVLLQVGRDGVFVQTRPCWEEASCGTLAVFDRDGKRRGTVYLGQMPESDQPTMTARLTQVIVGVLKRLGGETPTLRYVTDAGCHPQAYYREVLAKMKHPVSGERLKWSWGVDFFHACEYVAKLAGAIFGAASERANEWAEEQRHILRHEKDGVSRVIRSAAQQRRRVGLKGTKKDYQASLNYFKKYRAHMDFAARRDRGEPIGSGITEAGCKVIFNQRLKQSGMRWHRQTGQQIVDLRTATRSGLWRRIWQRITAGKIHLPAITPTNTALAPTKTNENPLPA